MEELVLGSESLEKAFWSKGRDPVEAAMDSASFTCSETWSVDEDAPIFSSSSTTITVLSFVEKNFNA